MLAASLMGACSSSSGQALITLQVTVAGDVPSIETLSFTSPDHPAIRERSVGGESHRPSFGLGYYVPDPKPTVTVVGRAVLASGCVAGEGTVSVSGVTAGGVIMGGGLSIVRLAVTRCPTPDGGGGTDGGSDATGTTDVPADAAADRTPEPTADATAPTDARTDAPGDIGGGSPPGSVVWARSASSAYLLGVAESSTGIIVSGYISAPADLGGSLLAPVGSTDTVVAQYAASDGAHLYSGRFGGGTPVGTGSVFGYMDTVSSGSAVIHGFSSCNPAGTPACNGINLGLGSVVPWDPLESTCRHASLSIL